MKEIPLSQGKFAQVNDADFERVSAFKWCVKKDRNTFYAGRAFTSSPGKQTWISLHYFLTGLRLVDHQDGNGLNNQRYNLRPATIRQNGQNRKKFSPASSSFKGVTWHARDRKWSARIRAPERRYNLGYFKTEVEAACAYNAAAVTLFREFANLNIIP